ncbi:MAG TPA: DNA recombination protein RmuC [Psychromonas sp.]
MLLSPLTLLISTSALIFSIIILFSWALLRSKRQRDNLYVEQQLTRQELLHIQNINVEKSQTLLEKQLFIDSLQRQTSKLTIRLREAEVRLQSANQRLREQQENEQKLSNQFELLSQRIFSEKSAQFKQLNQDSITQLLDPLKTQLDGFKQQVTDCYINESKERYNLQNEISKLAKLNALMQQETNNLTNALKGDNKQQGNWGEVILQRILESSGLREGHEYKTQTSFKNDRGERLQPDVIVQLPQNKNIIIDSKVSLVAYERFFNADNPQAKKEALQAHIVSIRQHIKGLGKKDYQHLIGTNSLDYVLLFVAVEPAFITALEHDPELLKLALDNNVLLASPTNLMIALRTIDNLWRFEQQEQNGRLIAQQAGKLYDKLRLFSQNMLDVGAQLSKAQNTYDRALKQLGQGRGNIIQQAEQLKAMGVTVTKPLPESLVELADLEPPIALKNHLKELQRVNPSDAKNDVKKAPQQ